MSTGVTFIGVDLAWRSDTNPSGAAVLRGNTNGAEVVHLAQPLCGNQSLLSYIRDHTTDSTVVAIDAPLIIANQTGQRRCETLIGNRYGGRHASCHTSNLALYPDAASVNLVARLCGEGFKHPPSDSPLLMLEVYPHAAMVELFDLPSIVQYKKGPVGTKREGLQQLQRLIRSLSLADPPLHSSPLLNSFISADVTALAGRGLKNYEDAIDALFCAYLACFYWRWRSTHTEIFGDLNEGYIVNPICPIGRLQTGSTQPLDGRHFYAPDVHGVKKSARI